MDLWLQSKRQRIDYESAVQKCVHFYTDDLKEVYLKNFLEIEIKDNLTEASKTFKAYQKLEIFLNGGDFHNEMKSKIL